MKANIINVGRTIRFHIDRKIGKPAERRLSTSPSYSPRGDSHSFDLAVLAGRDLLLNRICDGVLKDGVMIQPGTDVRSAVTHESRPNGLHEEQLLLRCDLDEFIELRQVESKGLAATASGKRQAPTAKRDDAHLFAQNVLTRQQRILGILIMHRMRRSDVNDINVPVRKDVCVGPARSCVFGIGGGEDAVDEFLGRGHGAGTDGGDEVLDIRGVTPEQAKTC